MLRIVGALIVPNNKGDFVYLLLKMQLFLIPFSYARQYFFNLGGYRLSVIIGGIIWLIFSPFIIETFFIFIKKAKWSYNFLCVYFILHPWLIASLVLFGFRQLPAGTSSLSVVLSFSSWLIAGTLLLLAYVHWDIRHYERFMRLLWKIAFLIAVESIFDFYLLMITPLQNIATDGSRYISLIVSNGYISGCLGFILYTLSLYYRKIEGNKIKFALGIFLGILLVLACQERSIIFGCVFLTLLLVLFHFFSGWRKRAPEITVFRAGFWSGTSIVMIIGLLFALNTLRHEASSLDSFYDRIMKWTRGIEIGSYYFPIGCGGNFAGKYNVSPVVPSRLSFDLLDYEFSDENAHKVFRYIYDREASGEGDAANISLHSVHIDLYAEFGMLGILIIIVLFYYPSAYLIKNRRLFSRTMSCQLTGGYILAFFLIVLQIPLFMISSGDNILWVVGILYLFFFKKYFSIAPLKNA